MTDKQTPPDHLWHIIAEYANSTPDALKAFRNRWRDLEIQIVGMATDSDGSWTAAEGVDKEPVHYDTIIIGRRFVGVHPAQGCFDVFDLGEGTTLSIARRLAQAAADLLGKTHDDIEER